MLWVTSDKLSEATAFGTGSIEEDAVRVFFDFF
jgi:hypothetical protein